MSVSDIISERGIEEILHFTTYKGIGGIFESGYIKSRDQLEESNHLEYIFTANVNTRKDPDWTDYVSLSIERTNKAFFDYSIQWNKDSSNRWYILSLDVDIISHEDVVFATTNNIYSNVSRGRGQEGLERLYEDTIVTQLQCGKPHAIEKRYSTMPEAWPTCRQAEVLYPGEISIKHLNTVYCRTDDDREAAIYSRDFASTPESFDIVVEPSRFEN